MCLGGKARYKMWSVRTHRWRGEGEVTAFIAESCHRVLNRVDVYWLVLVWASSGRPLVSSLCHCLSFAISCPLHVIPLTHVFTQVFCLSLLLLFFNFPVFPTSATMVLFLLTCHRRPPPFLLVSCLYPRPFSPESEPELVMQAQQTLFVLSHHKAPLALCLSLRGTCEVGSIKSYSSSRATLTSKDFSEVS